jgi:hypothetical protein
MTRRFLKRVPERALPSMAVGAVCAGSAVSFAALAFAAPLRAVAATADAPLNSALTIDFVPAHADLSLDDHDNPKAEVIAQVPETCVFQHAGCPPGYGQGEDNLTYLVVTRHGQVVAQTSPGTLVSTNSTTAAVPDIELGDTVTAYGLDAGSQNNPTYHVAATAVYEAPPTFTSGSKCYPHIVLRGDAGTGSNYVAVDFRDRFHAIDASLSGNTFTVKDLHPQLIERAVYLTGIRYVTGPDGRVQINEWQPPAYWTQICPPKLVVAKCDAYWVQPHHELTVPAPGILRNDLSNHHGPLVPHVDHINFRISSNPYKVSRTGALSFRATRPGKAVITYHDVAAYAHSKPTTATIYIQRTRPTAALSGCSA